MAEPLLHTSTETQPPRLQAISRRQDVDDPADEVYVFMGSLRPFWGRALLYIVLLFVVVVLVWAWQSKVDVVASAPFRLVPLGNMQTVQAPRGGEIEVIGVKEGDHVEKGQMLFKLRSWETWQDLRGLEQAQMAFQKAEYDLKQAFPQKKELAQETISTLEKRLRVLEAVMAAHHDALETYRDVGGGKQAQQDKPKSDLQAQIGFRNAEIEHLKQQFLQQQKLFERQLISRTDMDRARVQYLGALASLPGRMAEIYKQDMVVQDLKHQILETRVGLEREAAQMKHAYKTAQLRLTQAQQKTDRILEAESDLILAPVDGIVTQVLLNTPGQVITKGQPLITLAPKQAPMVAEVMLLNKDVGLLKVGQVVKLKYDAFAFQDFGIQRGWLKQISPDALIDERVGPVFRGVVELEEAQIMVNGRKKPLMFGLKGVAEVVTNRQSILLMLLSPLRQLYESSTYRAETAVVERANHIEE
ncbi:MAG: HlyD family type I secretion membrane fusion protein [Candidatus Latescibacterota bacterium]|jgi:HlyD family type I secretion membrane fusion protein